MKHSVDLLEFESSTMAKHSFSIATISFFKGDFTQAHTYIKSRFIDIIKANPWLGGELHKGRSKNINLIYSDDIDIDSLFFMPKNLNINSELPYSEITMLVDDYIVKCPKNILNTKSKVSSLILTQTSDDEFALTFSLSHSVADGDTYYKLLNMFSKENEVYSLSVKRKHEVITQIKELVGFDSYNYFMGISHMLNVLLGMLRIKKTKVIAHYIDETKIQNIKNTHSDTKTCKYISTNDILTSLYGNFINSRLLTMAVNFRGKLKNLDNNDAGNYQNYVLYDKKIYNKPCGIRNSISLKTPFRCLAEKLPSFFEGVTCKMGLITNWSAFSKELYIQGAKEELHLPLIRASGKSPYEMAIIFRAKEDKKAIVYYSNRFNNNDFKNADLALGSCVSKEIFLES